MKISALEDTGGKVKKLTTRIYKCWFEGKYGTNISNKWSNILIFGISVEEKKRKYGKKKKLKRC